MEKFFRFLGKILGLKPLEKKDSDDEGKLTSEENPDLVQTINKISSEKCFSDKKITNAILDIQKTLKKIYNQFEANKIDEEKEIKWKYAAIVMDRFFLYLFIILNIVIFASTVMSLPSFYKMT